MIAGVYAGLHLALGTKPFAHSAYDSYTLQALRWREGEVALGRDYPHLELAVFENDWYVSFPPVPSVVQLVLTFFFGGNTPDGLLVKLYAVGAFLLTYAFFRISRRRRPLCAVAWALLFVFATDIFSISLDGGVWYQAQLLNQLLVTAAFFSMDRKKPTLACIFYALSVGCRPFSVFVGPLLLWMHLKNTRKQALGARFKKLLPGLICGLVIAGVYAWYNYIRFGDPLEFGHRYLPEYTRGNEPVFALSRIWMNAQRFLFGSPVTQGFEGWELEKFGFSMFLCNPILLLGLVWVLVDLVRRRFSLAKLAVLLMFLVHIACLFMHRTFGGFQFGARYTLELIPYWLFYLRFSKRRSPLVAEDVVCLYGLGVNAVGAYLLHR